MQKRLLILKLAAALLYAGPLVAGLGGQGWAVAPVFVLVFLLWQVVMRPADWRRTPLEWAQAPVMLAAVLRIAVLVLLVALLFGLGRGIGALLGHLPAIPAAAPVLASLLAVPLARLIWDPAKGAQMEAFLDDALAQVRGAAAPGGSVEEDLDAIVAPLLDLAEDTPDAVARAAVDRLAASPDWAILIETLRESLIYTDKPATAIRRGLALWSTDPATVDRLRGCGMPCTGWSAAGGYLGPEGLFATGALAALDAHPDRWEDFPMPADLRENAAANPEPEIARALTLLANRLEELERRDSGGGAETAADDGGDD
ncbi:MAG TPA: hypothetical protein VLA78_07150 [Paracoccaceae bacterium]|nr:hypothetical protein [Paracoccaceae bacterium]